MEERRGDIGTELGRRNLRERETQLGEYIKMDGKEIRWVKTQLVWLRTVKSGRLL
jgi:hypothetical protein